MQRSRIRSRRAKGITPLLLVGAVLGLATGFLLGELFAGRSPRALARAMRPGRSPGKPNPFDLTSHLQIELERVLGPDAQTLELVPVARSSIELHGWVSWRRTRTRALNTAREALGPEIRLVDCLLVWGEDDAPPTGEFPTPEERETA